MKVNNYQQVGTETLISVIQRGVILIEENKKSKKLSNTVLSNTRQEIFFMRQEVHPRLRKLDRMDSKFFPIGCHIVFTQPKPDEDLDDWSPVNNVPDRDGVVTRYQEEWVIVQLEGDDFEVMIKPQYLKIKWMR